MSTHAGSPVAACRGQNTAWVCRPDRPLGDRQQDRAGRMAPDQQVPSSLGSGPARPSKPLCRAEAEWPALPGCPPFSQDLAGKPEWVPSPGDRGTLSFPPPNDTLTALPFPSVGRCPPSSKRLENTLGHYQSSNKSRCHLFNTCARCQVSFCTRLDARAWKAEDRSKLA